MKSFYTLLVASFSFAMSMEVNAENYDCPKVQVNNPFQIINIQPNDPAWKAPPIIPKSYLNCRSSMSDANRLRCNYKPGANMLNTYVLLRDVPEDSTCVAKKPPACGFTCTKKL